MRANAVILIVIGLLLLVGIAGAVIQVSVTGNQSWLVAGSGSSAAYTVTVTNTTSGNVPIDGASITFSVDPLYGTMSPATVTTNSAGQAFSTFTVNTKSGTAPIIASISYSGSNGPFTMTQTIPQNIDHASPYYDFTVSDPIFTYPPQGTVATEVPFKVSILDKWGNPIDNRNPSFTHNVGLHASSALSPTEPYFVGSFPGSGSQDILLPLDANGTLTVNVRLTTKSGSNKIQMDPFEGKISTQIAWITAVADSVPYSMTGTISDGGILPANNVAKFTIEYYLYDKYANPIGNTSIWINTNLSGETLPTQHYSDNSGLIRFYYGPKISILTANITAIANDTPSLKKNLIANFVSSNIADNIILVISPETMASWETDPSTTRQATVVASLTDSWGNPVNNKNVTFTISDIVTAPFNKTADPSFESPPSLTPTLEKTVPTVDGNAIITFYPGAFVTSGTGYADGATGSCKVTATSDDLTSNTVNVEWKNYAYLSVAVNVTPQKVHVNDTVDVTIQITGDGYKMVTNPITVVLDMDTSSSMNANDKSGEDRFINSKIAGKSFVGSLKPQDQVGLVTYGEFDNYQYWQLVSNLSYNHMLVNNSIDSLIKSGGLDISVRESVDEAVTRIKSNPLRPEGEVAAIITLGDSAYNNKMDDYNAMVDAWKVDHIRIYTIQYISSNRGCNTGDTKVEQMHTLADNAGGIPYCCTDKEEVIEALGEIKQNLSTIAGVNTSMNLDFQNVAYVYNNTTYYGNDTVSYIANGPFVNHTKENIDSEGRTSIIWTDGNQSVVDQTDDWNDDFNLNFTIGTIHIKETWETTFRLNINKEGIIDLFGPGSKISYNGGSGSLIIPTTFIISVNETVPLGLQSGTLYLDLLSPNGQNYNTSVPMRWDLNYTGFDRVTETYWYSFRNQPFVQFGAVYNIPNGTYTHSTDLDVKNFPAGDYQVKVIASVPGIPSAEDTGAFTKFYDNASVNILLR